MGRAALVLVDKMILGMVQVFRFIAFGDLGRLFDPIDGKSVIVQGKGQWVFVLNEVVMKQIVNDMADKIV